MSIYIYITNLYNRLYTERSYNVKCVYAVRCKLVYFLMVIFLFFMNIYFGGVEV